jgi:uncharacterized membrane protein
MNAAELGLAVSVFLACAVEAVEALTIVMAVGYSRSWSSALAGVGTAMLALGAIVAGLGSALSSLPIDDLRLLIGAVLLALGVQWLRKAVLRAAGLKALHDERKAFEHQSEAALAAQRAGGGFDAYSFSVSLQGVLVEGLEVALIVITFGANQHHIPLAAAAAGASVAVVIVAGFAARAPLARVPENTMKFTVGVLLSAFGIFWLVEGAGASWPGGDAALLVLVPAVLGAAILATVSLRRRSVRLPPG